MHIAFNACHDWLKVVLHSRLQSNQSALILISHCSLCKEALGPWLPKKWPIDLIRLYRCTGRYMSLLGCPDSSVYKMVWFTTSYISLVAQVWVVCEKNDQYKTLRYVWVVWLLPAGLWWFHSCMGENYHDFPPPQDSQSKCIFKKQNCLICHQFHKCKFSCVPDQLPWSWSSGLFFPSTSHTTENTLCLKQHLASSALKYKNMVIKSTISKW